MKHTCLRVTRPATGAFAFLAIASFNPVAAPAAPATRLAFPSGMIKYRMTMSGSMAMNSDVVWTWANGGTLFRQDLHGSMKLGTSGKPVQTNTWTFSDGKALYTGVPSGMPGQPAMGKMAIKTALPPGFLANMMQMRAGLTASNPSRVVGHATILGKPCEIRAVNMDNSRSKIQSKVWIWQSLPLRTEVTTTSKGRDGQVLKITSVATQINTGFKPAASVFRVPAGYKVQDMAAFQKQMSGKRQ